MIDIKKKELILVRERKRDISPVYWNNVLQTGDGVMEIYGKRMEKDFILFRSGVLIDFKLKYQWDEVASHIASRLISDHDFLTKLTDLAEVAMRDGSRLICELYKLQMDNLSNDILLEKVEAIRKSFMAYDEITVPSWLMAGEVLKQRIIKRLKCSDEDMNLLSLPAQKTYVSLYDKELLMAVLSPKKVEDYAQRLSEKYYWIPFGYDGPTIWDRKYFIEKITEMRKNPSKFRNSLKEIKKQEITLAKRIDSIKKRLNFQSNQWRLIEVMRKLAVWTDERKMLDYQFFYQYYRMLGELSKRHGGSIKELKYLFTEELANYIKNPKKYLQIANKRISSDILVIVEKGQVRIGGPKETRAIFNYLKVASTATKEIRGTIASRGPKKFYRAIVKIVLSSIDMNKVDKGDIIVATMTTPDYAPVMSKAIGFITDEGGVTSHAAIVAREMNKPCIVDTKIATKIFHDGDLVEVDADKGMVKIIKKANK